MRFRTGWAVAALLLVSSCDFDLINWVGKQVGLPDDYFPEYLDKNLLENYGFEATDGEGSSKWTKTTTDAYMSWEVPTEPGVPTTFTDLVTSVTTPVYRLEIKNLIPNGDFEEELVGATALARSFWVPRKAPTTSSDNLILVATSFTSVGTVTNLVGDPRVLNNKAVGWDSNGNGNRLQLNLKEAAGNLWTVGSYRVRMDLINVTGGSGFELHLMVDESTTLGNVLDAQDSGNWVLTTATDARTVFSVSKAFTVDDSLPNRVLNFGNDSPDATTSFKGIFDNVRLVRADQECWARTDFPSLSSGSLKLLPGSKVGAYTLALTVRDDATAEQTSAGHVKNRFFPQGLTVRLTAQVNSGTGTYLKFFPRPAEGWADWTALEMELGFDFKVNDADLGTEPALRIEISPTNNVDVSTDGRDAGSLLVTQPVLEFHSLI